MTQISVLRINILRVGYLLLVAGLGSVIWPTLLDPSKTWSLMGGIEACMLGALSALSIFGLRYPLQMLPLLLFEMAWKSIWLLRVALPLWLAHRLDAATANVAFECGMVVVFPVLIPWDHIWRTYARRPGDPWRRRGMADVALEGG